MNSDIYSKIPDSPLGPWDVAVVGSGPAGLTAAIYTTRGAASTIILAGDAWGGQLMLTSMVDNFPGFPKGIMGPELMENMKDQAVRFGAKFIPQNTVSSDLTKNPFELTIADGKTYLAKSIVIATGAETKWLGVSGESRLIGRGVSTCAPCDAPFFKDKTVLVVGGGDSAMEEALVLTKYAAKVTIIHRRDKFAASAAMQKRVLSNKKINIVWNSQVVEMKGEQKFEKVVVEDTLSGKESEIAADGIFVAIGHSPSSEIFKGIIDMDEKGFITKNCNSKYQTQTNIPGVFVSGDVHDNVYKQAITAAGLGCQAGIDVLSFLEEEFGG